jgi:hypothetical protein
VKGGNRSDELAIHALDSICWLVKFRKASVRLVLFC